MINLKLNLFLIILIYWIILGINSTKNNKPSGNEWKIDIGKEEINSDEASFSFEEMPLLEDVEEEEFSSSQIGQLLSKHCQILFAKPLEILKKK
uniref:Uncharacterized protein n=1 Tax=Meloidogyne enterolobii TaxID=390850 RepID=A0A6V7U6E9_MELEN|nr:unnamed protein product [Meloidogyne enterolobii]